MARDPDALDDATLALLIAPGLGAATIRRLRDRFGGDEAVLGTAIADLAAVDGLGPATAGAIRRALDAADPAAERRSLREAGAGLVLRGDEDYPPLLAAVPSPPEALWVRGALSAADRLAVAVVGSRRATAYGREQADRFAALLAGAGLTIVSGGALGIDAAAHRGALRGGGRTVAVMGCGLGTCYPPEHERLFRRIVAGGGALVSAYPMGVPPLAVNFPRRNRIISGMSLGVLVVEAARRSGALITARLAAEEHGREVMVLPGRVDSPASAGCFRLLREGGAALVTSHADVLGQLDLSTEAVRGALRAAGCPEAGAASFFDHALTAGQRALLEALGDAREPVPLEVLAARTGRALSELMADTTLLEIQGRLARDHRGLRIRARAAR